jgi:HAD superfamily hydrolase (TIGR01549 family)
LGKKFDAILFDLGSTLIYFDGEWDELRSQREVRLLQNLGSAGINLPGEAFLEQFNERLAHYYDERETEFIEQTTAYLLRSLLAEWGYPSPPDELIRQSLAGMYAVSQAYWKTEADAHPTLQWLREAGYRLGLISNAGDDADVQTLVDHADLREYFDVILTSAALGIRKPNPRIFQVALDHWGYSPAQAAMVGDSLGADILGARNAGLYSVWVTRHADTAANRDHEDTIQPDALITTLGELPRLLSEHL